METTSFILFPVLPCIFLGITQFLTSTQLLVALELSRLTMKTVKQNLWWAFGYNIVSFHEPCRDRPVLVIKPMEYEAVLCAMHCIRYMDLAHTLYGFHFSHKIKYLHFSTASCGTT